MKNIGYVRVSTREQCPDRQIDALHAVCDAWHVERLSAATLDRPVYRQMVESLEAGDTLVILDLDRAYRSTVDAITELEKLKERGIFLRILNMQLDTSSPLGLFFYTVMAAWGALERQTISVRTKEGLAAARERGKRLGRPPKLTDTQLEEARTRLNNPGQTVRMIAAEYDVAPLTLTRSLRKERTGARQMLPLS